MQPAPALALHCHHTTLISHFIIHIQFYSNLNEPHTLRSDTISFFNAFLFLLSLLRLWASFFVLLWISFSAKKCFFCFSLCSFTQCQIWCYICFFIFLLLSLSSSPLKVELGFSSLLIARLNCKFTLTIRYLSWPRTRVRAEIDCVVDC